MLRFLLDTNHLTLLEQCRPPFMTRFLRWRAEVATGIVCVQEVLKGRLAALAVARRSADLIRGYELLDLSISTASQVPVVSYDAIADGAYQHIRSTRPRIGSQDQRIAALAPANNLILVTRNTRDFVGISGLRLDDWSV